MSKDYTKCKKFVAFLDDNGYDGGESGFYITDVDSFNYENGVVIDDNYDEAVYRTIEDLEESCYLAFENHFTVERRLETVEDLAEFLKPLPWIVAVDENEGYVDPDKIAKFKDEKVRNMDIIESFKGNIIIDDVFLKIKNDRDLIDKYKIDVNEAERYFLYFELKYKIPSKDVCPGFETECKKFLEKYKDKLIYCLPADRMRVSLYAFDDEKTLNRMKENSSAYQKLLSILGRKTEKKTAKPLEQKQSISDSFLGSVKEFAKKEPDKVIIDYTFEKATKSLNGSNQGLIMGGLFDISQGATKKKLPFGMFNSPADRWIKNELENGHIVYCLPRGENTGILIAFENKKSLENILNESTAYVTIKNMVEQNDEDDKESDL